MIELIQFPWSPYCIVQRRILEYSGVHFKVTNIPNGDRSLVWKITRHRYYMVPVIRDGRTIIFETDEDSQVIAKYLDNKLNLVLFPKDLAGLQNIIWKYIENEVQDIGFRLNDIYWQEMVPRSDHLRFVRHKERRFGRGCLEQWRDQQPQLLESLIWSLIPFEQMLGTRPFLLDQRPRFVDFDLFGIVSNFLYSGHYELPAVHTNLKAWYGCMKQLKPITSQREKVHS